MCAADVTGDAHTDHRGADLAAFRDLVRDARRFVARTQRQLAQEVGLHPDVLSHKLNGHPGWCLNTPEVLGIVRALAAWGALGTRREAETLMRLMSVPPRLILAQDWDHEPLRHLSETEVVHSTSPVLTEVQATLRPVPPPQPITPLIGRTAEVATATAAVRSARLVTLTGVGGTGKTRIALRTAALTESAFVDGVAFADLAAVADPGMVGIALLRALGLTPSSTSSPENQLKDALRETQLLLVVDNMEHLLDASSVLGRLLTAAPALHLLVTSRVPLRIYGERQIRVPPLALPEVGAARSVSDLGLSPAVQLFVQRASAVQPGFSPGGAELEAVAGVCISLDGLPLAIELAAAKVGIWPVHAVLERLVERLPFLTDGARDLPRRQQTLRATLDWSDALLTQAERRLWFRLGVFSGWFDADAAAAVVAADLGTVLPGLAGLAEQSLLEPAPPTGRDPARFRMLESVREYALERLGATEDVDAVRRAHLRHYLALAARVSPRSTWGPDDRAHLDRLQADQANISTALAWAVARAELDDACLVDGLRLAIAVTRLWQRRASLPEGRTYLERLLDADARRRTSPPPLRVAALLRAALLSCTSGDFDRTTALAAEALDLSAELADRSAMSWAQRHLGEAALARDDLAAALRHFRLQLDLARQADDRALQADAYNMLGQTNRRLGAYADAEDQLRHALAGFEAVGDLDATGAVQGSLGDLAVDRGQLDVAAGYWSDALHRHWQTGNRRGLTYDLEGCAVLAASVARPRQALAYLTAARLVRERGGWVLPAPERALLEAGLASSLATLTENERQQIVALARTRAMAEIVSEAGQLLSAVVDGSALS